MKINSPAEGRITVDLTQQDMADLDITYEAMDYSTIETRRVIWTLLDEAGKALGKALDPSRRMIIEATPKTEGGCVLDFILLDSKKKQFPQKQFLRKQSENIICDFDCAENLLRAVSGCPPVKDSALYENAGKYRLVLGGFCDTKAVRSHFSEFGKVADCDRLVCGHTKEHWRNLIEKDAISVLSKS